jgi:hypothetical protein
MDGMTEPNPADIARRLTAAQRKVVLTNDRGFADHAKGKWHSMSKPTAEILFGLGLLEEPVHLSRPTELGLRVRAIMLGEGGK